VHRLAPVAIYFGHQARTARQMGWSAIKNGELLNLVSREFDVFVTVDQNLSFQQNTKELRIAVVVLCARTNRLSDLLPLVPDLLAAIPGAKPGTVQTIGKPAGQARG
jgi:hypothetical protein